MPLYLLIAMLAGVALFGWVAGMWTHKRAEPWCAACGWQLDCARWRWASGLLADDQQAEARAAGQRERDDWVKTRGPGLAGLGDASDAAESQP